MASTKNLKAVPTTGTMPRLDTKKIPKASWSLMPSSESSRTRRFGLNTNAGKQIGPPRASPEEKEVHECAKESGSASASA